MKNKNIGLKAGLLFVALTVSFCQKIIEPKDLPQQDPRLVMNCVLNKDSMIGLNLSASKSILSGKEYKFIDNAVCELYENGVFVEHLLNYKNGNYQSSVYPKINREYTIKASASGYEPIEGVTLLPDSAELINAERYDLVNSNYMAYNTGTLGATSIGGSTKCLIRIKTKSTIRNYFSIRSIISLYDSAGNFVQQPNYTYITNNSTNANNDVIYSGSVIEVSDENVVNGNEVLLDLGIGFSGDYPPVKYAEVSLVISTISEDLFKYRTTLSNQINTGVSLFAEPVIVFNNIKNGMGIMGSMNSSVYFLYNATIIKN
jgi:hypothetical protein